MNTTDEQGRQRSVPEPPDGLFNAAPFVFKRRLLPGKNTKVVKDEGRRAEELGNIVAEYLRTRGQ